LKFEYRVRDKQGRMTSGFLEAEHKNSVVQKLLGQGFYIVSLKEIVQSSKDIKLEFKFSTLRKVSTRDLVVFTQQLSTMLAAGLPIIRSFKILGEQTANAKLRKAILEIKEDIESGLALWEAVAKHPEIFSRIYISMIKAGELGGVLDPVLERLAYHLEREQEINAKVKSASIYPMIICIFAVLMVIFIITFVMPMFIGMFQSSGVQLPLPTRILLGAGAFIKTWGLMLLLGILATIYLMKRWGKTEGGRYFYDSLYLHLPLLGKTINRIAVARFARTMGTLVKSGIPVLQALEVMQEVVGNAVISRAIAQASSSIKEGETINVPLMETGVFEPMVTQMIAVGEETGTLDQMLMRMSDYYERELLYAVDALMAVIEPLLILVVAIMVGGVVVATLMPMFDMTTLVGS
jgi:type IV pilus assembly protein PilC